jgi:hypothetical protein
VAGLRGAYGEKLTNVSGAKFVGSKAMRSPKDEEPEGWNSKVLEKNVSDETDVSPSRIDELMENVKTNRVTHLIITLEDAAKTTPRLFVVPCASLHWVH